MIDKTQEYPDLGSDLLEKRAEIYDQLRYLANELEKLDHIFGTGLYYMTEREVRDYIKISDERPVPRDIPRTSFGYDKVYLKKDVDEYMMSRKR